MLCALKFLPIRVQGGDGWFDDPDNMASVMRGIEDAKQGRTKAYTIDEMRKMLDI